MKYRLVILLWIIFLIFSILFQNQYFLLNKVLEGSEVLYSSNDEQIDPSHLPYYEDIEYFYIYEAPTNEIYIIGNDKFYENKGLVSPDNNQYYSNSYKDGYESIGPNMYFTMFQKTYYLSLDSFKGSNISSEYLLYFRSDNKEKMFDVQKYANKNDIGTASVSPDRLALKSEIFFMMINIFFILLSFLLLITDVNKHIKEVGISKMLGYKNKEIIFPMIYKQIKWILVYLIPLLLLFIILQYFNSLETLGIFKRSMQVTFKTYIIFSIIYIFYFGFVIKTTNIVLSIKGKQNSEVLKNISALINVISKIIIVIILVVLIVPSYKMFDVYNQYNEFIKDNTDYVRYDVQKEDVGKNQDVIYNKYNDAGAVTNIQSMDYEDSSEYIGEEQVMITNYNYMNLVGLSDNLEEDRSYLLIPRTMKNSNDEIKEIIDENYITGEYEELYYEPQKIYTYKPSSYYTTSGYIYYPIIVVINDLSQTLQDDYIMSDLYYENENSDVEIEHLTDQFFRYEEAELDSFLIFLVFFILMIFIILLSTYYMMQSYLEINGKEIAVKRILGYEKFNIYREFYILDFIYYIFGGVLMYLVSISFSIPLWFIIIFIGIMILLNEFGRRVMIRKVEKNKIVNVLKGEV